MNELIAKLDGRRFSAATVKQAIHIDQNTLTNYLSKTPIELCSETAGQGRSRQYCLIDVYQLALLSVLTKITGSADWSAKALNNMLYGEFVVASAVQTKMQQHGLKPSIQNALYALSNIDQDKEILAFKDRSCISIKSCPEFYWNRDILHPTFLLADEHDLKFNPTLYARSQKEALSLFSAGVVVNVTSKLLDVDYSLAQSPEMRGKDA